MNFRSDKTQQVPLCLCDSCCAADPRRRELRAHRAGEAASLRRELGTRGQVLAPDRPARSKARKPPPPTKPRRASARPVPELGRRLRAAREAINLSQSAVAARLGVEQPTISAWESCRSTVPADRRGELSQVLRVKLEALFPPGEIP